MAKKTPKSRNLLGRVHKGLFGMMLFFPVVATFAREIPSFEEKMNGFVDVGAALGGSWGFGLM